MLLRPSRWGPAPCAGGPITDVLAAGCGAGFVAAGDSGRSSGGASPKAGCSELGVGSSGEVSGWDETDTASGDSRLPPDPAAAVSGAGAFPATGSSDVVGVTGSAGGSDSAGAGSVDDAVSGRAGAGIGVGAVVTGWGEAVAS